jgi:exopolyphosphatase/guanosine-5'-triphosphate,3'-diphosphate pyrophosphatase
MKKFGIIDIGSNTVVLVIYTYDNGQLTCLQHCSQAVGLISYVKDGVLLQEGIDKVKPVLLAYQKIQRQMQIDRRYAFITEPARGITNVQDVLHQFETLGIRVKNLSGHKEAEYDYYGARNYCPGLKEGLIFDIGGGSSELISFRQDQMLEAISVPIGSVRLSKMPDDPSIPDNFVRDAIQKYPQLSAVNTSAAIAIGGTMKAVGILCSHLYKTGDIITTDVYERLYHDLKSGQPEAAAQLNEVDADRRPLILPGMAMGLSVLHHFRVQSFSVSQYGVREGFLFCHAIARAEEDADSEED